jgi:hypothetical protein
VAVRGVVGEGGRAVGEGVGVADGAQAVKSRAARRVKVARRPKRAPVMALHLERKNRVSISVVSPEGLLWAGK